jgi:hypothetical protein
MKRLCYSHIFFKKGLSFIVLVESKRVEISVTWYLERKYALATFSIVQPHSELPTCLPALALFIDFSTYPFA